MATQLGCVNQESGFDSVPHQIRLMYKARPRPQPVGLGQSRERIPEQCEH
jgi:hypothetical protein